MTFLQRLRSGFVGRPTAEPTSAEQHVRRVRELLLAGEPEHAARLSEQGLAHHPDHADLRRVAAEARDAERASRRAALHARLAEDPSNEVHRELCDLLLKDGEPEQALAVAERWAERTDSGEATYHLAAAHAELFFESRRSREGMTSFQQAVDAARRLPEDPRPLRLQFEIARRCGAWSDARRALTQLLEIMPGNGLIEGRLRSVVANCAHSRSLPKALAEVERSGRFLDDDPAQDGPLDRAAVRAGLQELAARPEVHVAFLLRGKTALVQGAQGPSAKRSARAVRDTLGASRGAARKLGLGDLAEVRCEGAGGALVVTAGAAGTSAVWAARMLSGTSRGLMGELVAGPTEQEAA